MGAGVPEDCSEEGLPTAYSCCCDCPSLREELWGVVRFLAGLLFALPRAPRPMPLVRVGAAVLLLSLSGSKRGARASSVCAAGIEFSLLVLPVARAARVRPIGERERTRWMVPCMRSASLRRVSSSLRQDSMSEERACARRTASSLACARARISRACARSAATSASRAASVARASSSARVASAARARADAAARFARRARPCDTSSHTQLATLATNDAAVIAREEGCFDAVLVERRWLPGALRAPLGVLVPLPLPPMSSTLAGELDGGTGPTEGGTGVATAAATAPPELAAAPSRPASGVGPAPACPPAATAV